MVVVWTDMSYGADQKGRDRRHVGAGLLAVPFLLYTPQSLAVIKGYEPMPALKDKDYGKPRMTYVGCSAPSDNLIMSGLQSCPLALS